MSTDAKRCSRCKCLVLISDFGKNKSSKDGLSHYCRECSRAYAKARRDARPDLRKREAEYTRSHYRENSDAIRTKRRKRYRDSDYDREYDQRYRANNKDKIAEQNRVQYLKNKEQSAARVREYRKQNPQWHRDQARLYKARRRAARCDLTAREIREIVSGECEFCGSKSDLTLAHDIPVSKGGASTADNCFCLCRSCNSRMRTRTKAEVLAMMESGEWT